MMMDINLFSITIWLVLVLEVFKKTRKRLNLSIKE
jgi:hypothetical protein